MGERESIIKASRLTKLLMTVYDRITHHFLEACENGSYFYYTEIKLSNKQKKQAFYLIHKARTTIIIAHNY